MDTLTTTRKNAGPPPWVGAYSITWVRVWNGSEPAESLPTALRAALFRTMIADGCSIVDVAAWTRTTVYTVCRVLGTPTDPEDVDTVDPDSSRVPTTCHYYRK